MNLTTNPTGSNCRIVHHGSIENNLNQNVLKIVLSQLHFDSVIALYFQQKTMNSTSSIKNNARNNLCRVKSSSPLKTRSQMIIYLEDGLEKNTIREKQSLRLYHIYLYYLIEILPKCVGDDELEH